MADPQEGFRFEIAFSFAGSHRDKARAIAEIVSAKLDPGLADRRRGKVFFDEWFDYEILGPNMRVLLQRIYGERSLMVGADASRDYADRPWAQAEAEAIHVKILAPPSLAPIAIQPMHKDHVNRRRTAARGEDQMKLAGLVRHNRWSS